MIKHTKCNPIMLRLGWSDAMTYDSAIASWPYCGGVNGSVRLDYELNLAPNAGLSKAISLLTPIKRKHRSISWADLIQMAAVVSVYTAGGPLIELDYGRIDAPANMYDEDEDEDASNKSPMKKQNRFRHASGSSLNSKVPILPQPFPPYPDGAPSADVHIRNIFYRLGLNNRDTVALCGAHTLGRAFKDRTGVCPFSTGDQGATKYTKPTAIASVSVSDNCVKSYDCCRILGNLVSVWLEDAAGPSCGCSSTIHTSRGYLICLIIILVSLCTAQLTIVPLPIILPLRVLVFQMLTMSCSGCQRIRRCTIVLSIARIS